MSLNEDKYDIFLKQIRKDNLQYDDNNDDDCENITNRNLIEERIVTNAWPSSNSQLPHKDNSNSNTSLLITNKAQKPLVHEMKDNNNNNYRLNETCEGLIIESPINKRNIIHDENGTDLDKLKQGSLPGGTHEEVVLIHQDNKRKSEDSNMMAYNILKKKSSSNRSKVFNNNVNKRCKLNDKIIANDNTSINAQGKWNYFCYNDILNKNRKETVRNKAVFPNTVESTKKRNNTAKTVNKYHLGDTHSSNMFKRTTRLRSTFKPGKRLEMKHNQMLLEMNNPKNPYSTHWTNKILDKRYNMELCSNGFLNGIPVIRLNHKHNLFSKITKKQIKENLDKINKKNEANEIELKPEIDEQFNTNMKNFFKARKDIQEEAVENEDSDEEKKKALIEFPMIYNFFRR